MQKKNFVVKVSRTIKEYCIMDVSTTSAQKARTIAEHETDRDLISISPPIFQRDPDSLPGKITTEIVKDPEA